MVHRFAVVSLLVLSSLVSGGCGDNQDDGYTIADAVKEDPRLSAMASSLRSAKLLRTLDGADSYTLFAPTNAALSTIDTTALSSDNLQGLMQYHVHKGDISQEKLKRVTALSTLVSSEIHVRYGLDGILFNDGAAISAEPIVTDNGTIYVLDKALSRPLQTTTKTFLRSPNTSLDFFNTDFIAIPDAGFVHSMKVFVNIEQEDVSQLRIFLTNSVTNTTIPLLQRTASHLENVNLTFADSSPNDIVHDVSRDTNLGKGAFPETTYRPVLPLEYLVGEPLEGEWILTIYDFTDDSEVRNRLVQWKIELTYGGQAPEPAIVFNPRQPQPEIFASTFIETALVEIKRVGGLAGEVLLAGTLGDLSASPKTLLAKEVKSPLLFAMTQSPALGEQELSLSAQQGDISRIMLTDTLVAAPRAEGIDMLAHLPLALMGAPTEEGNDIWGWTDPLNGNEYALMGTTQGTAFIDLTTPSAPVFMGTLPTHSEGSIWRDIKVYQNYAYIVSEAADHGLQVFDLTLLRDNAGPQTYAATAHIGGFGNAHNIAINEDSGLAYIVGSDFPGCSGGILLFDLATPELPSQIGCFSGGVTNTQPGGALYPTDVYTHDIQCVLYNGPDTDHQGKELCFSSDEQSIGIVDMSNPNSPVQIVRSTYENAGYTHQGWLTEDHQYFIVNDEFDEVDFDLHTRSYIWDLRDLDTPVLMGVIDNPSDAIGHNTYIKDNIAYQANYTSGIRLVDLSDITNASPEVAYFDTYPDDDLVVGKCTAPQTCGRASYDGAWSDYPFFASGIIVVSDIQRGLFVLKRSE